MTQEIKNFGKFYRLLAVLPDGGDRAELKERLVWQFTDGRTGSLREMRKEEYARMCAHLETIAGEVPREHGGHYGREAEKWRKRAIAAIFGFYQKIGEPVGMDYVKAILCRAAGGARDINQIAPSKLREIYNCWLMKQRVKGKVDGILAEELKKYGLTD